MTSSPGYPRANGAAERMVQMMKNILDKSADPFLGLLAYRTFPLSTGFSSAELMMNRTLWSTIPSANVEFNVTDQQQHYIRNQMYKQQMKQNHDARHRVKELSTLAPGDQVFIHDMHR